MADQNPSGAAAAGQSVRMVKCVKLDRELPGLDRIPWKGEKVMEEHMEQFFFGEGAKLPEGYVAPKH